MTFAQHILTLRRLSTAVACTALAACGGGGGADGQNSPITQTAAAVSNGAAGSTPANSGAATNTGSTGNSAGNSAAPANSSNQTITDVRFENTGAAAQTNVPVTFGQVFAKGNFLANEALSGRLEDGTIVPLQVDIKATHDDGSIRHAVLSAVLPKLNAGATRTMTLVKTGSAPTGAVLTPSAIMRTGFSFSAHAKINGTDYYASADDLFKTAKPTTWLNGPIATEWMVDAPLQTTAGVKHPHLTAHFAIRWYPGASKARVDVTMENNWSYEPAPQNFVYDANIVLGGNAVYSKAGLTHYHHSRWRKMFWWNGTEPQVNIKHNTAYLINSRAVPNYDRSLTVPEKSLAELQTLWTGAITEPGGVGIANPYMPTTGGRNDIGLLPGWAVEYLLSMDKRAKMVTLGTADLAGTWSSHYRDKQTGYPISVIDYPYMTRVGKASDAYNTTLKRSEAFPACASADLCKTANEADSAHQPNFAYLPYLVTGDYYYLEELQFWAMWDAFASNPYYREFEKGLVISDQVRGQAWSLRTLAEAAYITPDSHPLKSHFTSVVNANLDWYNTTYVKGEKTSNALGTNALGIVTNGSSLVYDNGTGMGPWQDDFFTASVGHAADLGFTKADALLRWKAKFPIDRMIGAGSCWIGGAMYTMKVRDNATSPIYSTIAQAFKASSADYTSTTCASAAMASVLKLKVGEMSGYSSSTMGYPSNMQPALAYATDVGGTDGKRAWAQFMARTVKPDYSGAPQFAIIPR